MSRVITAVFAMTLGLMAPIFANAEDGERWSVIEDRMKALEDKLQASEATVKAQQEMLKYATPDVTGAAQMDSIFNRLEVGGHVSASYIYSFNNPDLNGASQTLCQFNCNHNEFSLDAAKLEFGIPTDGPGTAGFQLDILYGQNASILSGAIPASDGAASVSGASDTDMFIQQAYIAYNYNDVEVKFGKFETLLGFELLDTYKNPNVTHGVLFTFAIPLYHTGVLASGALTEEIGYSIGVVNGFNNTNEAGDNKGVLGQVSYSSGPVFASLSTFQGTLEETRTRNSGGITPVGDNEVHTQIYDLVTTYEVDDATMLWLNVDVGHTDTRPNLTTLTGDEDGNWWGVALGGKRQLSDKASVAARYERFQDDASALVDNNFRIGAIPIGSEKATVDTVTLTFAYQLTESLLARLEFRHDVVDCDNVDCNVFASSDSGAATEDENDLGIFEVTYVLP